MSFLSAKNYNLKNPKDLKLESFKINIDCLKSNEFCAKTVFSAISPGTETGAYLGLEHLKEGVIYPRLVGYCNVAKIIRVGSDVKSIKEGEFVLTFQSHKSHYIQPIEDFYLNLGNISLSVAKKYACIYLLHLGFHSLLTAKNFQGLNVGIVGCGTLGYSTALMSEISGSKTFIFSNQKSVSKIFSKSKINVFNKKLSSVRHIHNLTNNIGLDIIINTSNKWEDWKFCLEIVNKSGKIINLGFPGRGEKLPHFNPLLPKYTYFKNLTIKSLCALDENDSPYFLSRFNLKNNLLYIKSLIDSNLLDLNSFISAEIHYTDLEKQYKKYASRSSLLFTTILKW